MKSRVSRGIWLPIGLVALLAILVMTLTSNAGAQTPGETADGGEPTSETGAPTAIATEQPTPGPDVSTIVRIVVPDTVEQPVPEGDEFEVQVFVEQVEHLAGFEFNIAYDPERLEPVLESGGTTPSAGEGTPTGADEILKTANLGEVLLTDGRTRDDILCSDPLAQSNTALATCSILAAPVCAGGPTGVSGDGLLGSVFFKSRGGGITNLTLTKSTLVLDDVAPPCPESEESDFIIQEIPHRQEDATVDLASGSDSNTMLIAIVIVVVALVVAGAGAGYLFYRRRQQTAAQT